MKERARGGEGQEKDKVASSEEVSQKVLQSPGKASNSESKTVAAVTTMTKGTTRVD